LPNRIRDAVLLINDAYKGWSDDDASRLAAALAFYAIFAIAPLLIIVIEIAAIVLGGAGRHNAVLDQILNEARPAIGDAGTKVIAQIVDATISQRSTGQFASIIAWVLFAVAATGLISAVQDALDTIWHIKPAGGIARAILDRLKSLTIIGTAAVIVVAMWFATAWITAFVDRAAAKIANAALLLIAVTIITATIYKWHPRVRLSWRDALVGAAVSSVLSVAGQYLIGMYLGRAAVTSAYGAAGSLVAVLIWLYYSAEIFLFGAEITKAYANRFGSHAGAGRAERGTLEAAGRSLSV
jgi:membrane protein